MVICYYFALILGLIKVSANFVPKVFTVIFFLFVFCYEAASDSISDQFGQMTRQQQLEQQTKNRDAAWREELWQEFMQKSILKMLYMIISTHSIESISVICVPCWAFSSPFDQ